MANWDRVHHGATENTEEFKKKNSVPSVPPW